MKKIQDIIKKKQASVGNDGAKDLDEKTIARVFLEAARSKIKKLEDTDISDIKLKENTLYIKTAHPVVSSELFMQKEKILEEVNKIAGRNVVEKIII